MTPTTPDPQHVEELARLVKVAKDALEAAKDYADTHALSFQWSEKYGSTEQKYLGRGFKESDWEDSGCEWEDSGCYDSQSSGRWASSSDDC